MESSRRGGGWGGVGGWGGGLDVLRLQYLKDLLTIEGMAGVGIGGSGGVGRANEQFSMGLEIFDIARMSH
jgi:hypothetical protein